MEVLEQFNEIKEDIYKKYEQYVGEGKTHDEAFTLLKSDTEVLFKFVEDNQDELCKELNVNV